MIAARLSTHFAGAAKPSGPTARDYVQSGLVAMWDGIENAGWGQHDASATTWVDLIGSRHWSLGPAESYAWTQTSFDARDQFAATQDFIPLNTAGTIEVCARIKADTVSGNYALIILGREAGGPYYGLLYRNNRTSPEAIMSGRSYFTQAFSQFNGVPASFSFPDPLTIGTQAFFNGVARLPDGSNTLDYNATTRGTVARIGGTLLQPMPLETYSIRIYSRAISAAEIATNHAVDVARFNLP